MEKTRCHAFGHFHDHITGKSVGHQHIVVAVHNIAAFNVPFKVDRFRRGQSFVGFPHHGVAFMRFGAVGKKHHFGPFFSRKESGVGIAQHGKVHQVRSIGVGVGAAVQHHFIAFQRREREHNGGAFHAFDASQHQNGRGQLRRGGTAGDHGVGFAFGHCRRGQINGRIFFAAQIFNGLIHRHHRVGDHGLHSFGAGGKILSKSFFTADKDQFQCRIVFQRLQCSGNDLFGSMITAHSVN